MPAISQIHSDELPAHNQTHSTASHLALARTFNTSAFFALPPGLATTTV